MRAPHRLACWLANGNQIAISDLTRLECKAGPLMTGNTVPLNRFTPFYQSPDVRVLSLSADVCGRSHCTASIYTGFGLRGLAVWCPTGRQQTLLRRERRAVLHGAVFA